MPFASDTADSTVRLKFAKVSLRIVESSDGGSPSFAVGSCRYTLGNTADDASTTRANQLRLQSGQ